MKTHAELAARLLREAATIFQAMSRSDDELGPRFAEFAGWYERVADLVEIDPTGELQAAGDAG